MAYQVKYDSGEMVTSFTASADTKATADVVEGVGMAEEVVEEVGVIAKPTVSDIAAPMDVSEGETPDRPRMTSQEMETGIADDVDKFVKMASSADITGHPDLSDGEWPDRTGGHAIVTYRKTETGIVAIVGEEMTE